MMAAHVFIYGSVQGVGYRGFVKSNAQKLGLTGWVRNTEDGGVEIILQGDKNVIEKMIELCRKGPFLSEVKQIGFEWEKVVNVFKEFTIT